MIYPNPCSMYLRGTIRFGAYKLQGVEFRLEIVTI